MGVTQSTWGLKAERPKVSFLALQCKAYIQLQTFETLPSSAMWKLITKPASFLLLLSLFNQQADCCSSSGERFLAGAGAVGSIVGGVAGVAALVYPVDVYPSRCKRNHYQVCTMTEPNSVRVGMSRKWQICKKGSTDCVQRCGPEPYDRSQVREIKRMALEVDAEFNVHRRKSDIPEYC